MDGGWVTGGMMRQGTGQIEGWIVKGRQRFGGSQWRRIKVEMNGGYEATTNRKRRIWQEVGRNMSNGKEGRQGR